MNEQPANRPSLFSSLFILLLEFSLFSALLTQIFVIVPRQKRTFDELGLALPAVTLLVIRLDNFFAAWSFIFLPLALLSFTAFAGLFLLMRHRLQVTRLATLLALLLMVGLIVLNGFILLAMALPAIKLAEGMSK